jgi:hypothetical protein
VRHEKVDDDLKQAYPKQLRGRFDLVDEKLHKLLGHTLRTLALT